MILLLVGALCLAAMATGTFISLDHSILAWISAAVGLAILIYLASWDN